MQQSATEKERGRSGQFNKRKYKFKLISSNLKLKFIEIEKQNNLTHFSLICFIIGELSLKSLIFIYFRVHEDEKIDIYTPDISNIFQFPRKIESASFQ